MSKLFLCNHCGEHHLFSGKCNSKPKKNSAAMTGIALAALLGLTACGDEDDKDTADTGGSDIQVEDSAMALYGVPDTAMWDNDGDGYTPDDGDCNDNDSTVNPGATETAGDGIDSNCDGEDDT